jgi:hypothetical protein
VISGARSNIGPESGRGKNHDSFIIVSISPSQPEPEFPVAGAVARPRGGPGRGGQESRDRSRRAQPGRPNRAGPNCDGITYNLYLFYSSICICVLARAELQQVRSPGPRRTRNRAAVLVIDPAGSGRALCVT